MGLRSLFTGEWILCRNMRLPAAWEKLHEQLICRGFQSPPNCTIWSPELIVPQKSKKLEAARGYLKFVKYQPASRRPSPSRVLISMAQRLPCWEHFCQPRRTPSEILRFHRLAIYGISAFIWSILMNRMLLIMMVHALKGSWNVLSSRRFRNFWLKPSLSNPLVPCVSP